LLHVPNVPPQLVDPLLRMQTPATQHRPPAHVLFAQQTVPLGCPHETAVPFKHTMLVPAVSPLATHDPLWQHPPPRHVLLAQQVCPAPPQLVHAPPVHTRPAPLQLVAFATQVFAAVSQQPLPEQVLPLQHGCPAAPQSTQLPPVHTRVPPPHDEVLDTH